MSGVNQRCGHQPEESSGMLGSLACAHNSVLCLAVVVAAARQYIEQRKAVSVIKLSCASDWE